MEWHQVWCSWASPVSGLNLEQGTTTEMWLTGYSSIMKIIFNTSQALRCWRLLEREIRLGRSWSMTEKMLNSRGWKTAWNPNPKTPANYVEMDLVKYQQGKAALKSCNAFLLLADHNIHIFCWDSRKVLFWRQTYKYKQQAGWLNELSLISNLCYSKTCTEVLVQYWNHMDRI